MASFCLSSVHFQVGQLRYIAIYFVLTGTCAHTCLAKLQAASQGRSSSSNGIIIIRPAVNTPNSTIGRLIIVTVIVCT